MPPAAIAGALSIAAARATESVRKIFIGLIMPLTPLVPPQRQALQQLPVEQQTLLELHYWESLDAAAIGAVLEIAPGTVRVQLHRARAQLREVMLSAGGTEVDEDGLDGLARALGRLV